MVLEGEFVHPRRIARDKRDFPRSPSTFSLETSFNYAERARSTARAIRSSRNCSRDAVKPRQSRRKSEESRCKSPADGRRKDEIYRSRRRNDSSIQPCSLSSSFSSSFRRGSGASFCHLARQTFRRSASSLSHPEGKKGRARRNPRPSPAPFLYEAPRS